MPSASTAIEAGCRGSRQPFEARMSAACTGREFSSSEEPAGYYPIPSYLDKKAKDQSREQGPGSGDCGSWNWRRHPSPHPDRRVHGPSHGRVRPGIAGDPAGDPQTPPRRSGRPCGTSREVFLPAGADGGRRRCSASSACGGKPAGQVKSRSDGVHVGPRQFRESPCVRRSLSEGRPHPIKWRLPGELAMSRKPSEIDSQAPVHWVDREQYTQYFNSLSAEDRWTNSLRPDQPMIWHWEDRRWWAPQEES